MKICLPTEDDTGLDARLCAHFGSAPYFAIKDTDTGDLQMVPNRGQKHQHGQCEPLGHLKAHNPDAVVVSGIGKRALARLNRDGIDVFVSRGETVAEALAEWEQGKLRKPSIDEVCGGHGHRQRHRG